MRGETAELAALLKHGAEFLKLNLTSVSIASFESYYELLEIRGQSENLTALKGTEEVARLHFLDSIALLNAAHFKGAKVIDIGSGAGFPGVAIRIAEPSVCLTLLDSSRKRISFLSELCDILGFEASIINLRAEEAAHSISFREKFDIAVSRAVARLNVLCELCLPFVRIGGKFIAMKGLDSNEELSEAGGAIESLGAELQDCFDYPIPGTDTIHRAILIKKTAKTPEKYPRRFAKIKNAPL